MITTNYIEITPFVIAAPNVILIYRPFWSKCDASENDLNKRWKCAFH